MRFSLRTLLIFVLLGGPICAFIASHFVEDYREAERRRVQEANARWWQAAVKASRTENAMYVISLETQAEFEKRFGHPIENDLGYWKLEQPKPSASDRQSRVKSQ